MKGFLSKIFQYLRVNPTSNHILPVGNFRFPAPGSQAEYIPPTSPAAEIANNPYYKRDMRRAFPVALVFENPTANLTDPLKGTSGKPPVPGVPYKYSYSSEQPPNEGYYTIHYVK